MKEMWKLITDNPRAFVADCLCGTAMLAVVFGVYILLSIIA